MSDSTRTPADSAPAPTLDSPAEATDGALDADGRRREHDIWVAGTEEP